MLNKIEGPVIGIDVATTYSVVCHYRNGHPEVIANDQGNRSTPSVVAFTENERLVGDSAKNQAAMNPTNTIYEIKRLMGRKWNDPKVQEVISKFPFQLVNKNDKPCVKVNYMNEEKTFTPEEITAMIIGEMKRTAESYLGEKVSHAVITVPAYFSEQQKQATKDAAVIAGLNVIRLISEPTSAAIAYGFDKQSDKERVICVIDAGGGTYDISILAMESGVFEVKAVGGDCFLGGADFDNIMVYYCVEEFKKQTGVNIRSNVKAMRRVKSACERAKRTLSTTTMTTIEVDSLAEGHDCNIKITKAKFETLTMDLLKKHVNLIEPVLNDAKISKNQVDDIVLVGGTTRIPKLRELISEFFHGKKLCTDINPDEAVAIGAAIQAAALTGKGDSKTDVLVVDVTPLSLGIETAGGVMTNIIDRNTTIPTSKSKLFSTYQDNQTDIEVKIYEGERAQVKHNNKLGTFTVSGLPPAPRGTLKIQITMSLDADGILEVTAKEESTGTNNNIKITNDTNRLSKADIERMINEAEKYKEYDEEIRKNKEAQNKLENYTCQIMKTLDELKEKLNEEDSKSIKDKCQEVLDWINMNSESSKAEDFEAKYEEIKSITTPILSKVYNEMPSQKEENKGPVVSEVD